MTKEDLQKRTKKFAIDIALLIDKLNMGIAVSVYSRQLIRSSSSVGANYRAACRAKSDADFINKLKIVEEEADESLYFLELLSEIDKKNNSLFQPYIKEANELLSIFVASIKTIKNKTLKK